MTSEERAEAKRRGELVNAEIDGQKRLISVRLAARLQAIDESVAATEVADAFEQLSAELEAAKDAGFENAADIADDIDLLHKAMLGLSDVNLSRAARVMDPMRTAVAFSLKDMEHKIEQLGAAMQAAEIDAKGFRKAMLQINQLFKEESQKIEREQSAKEAQDQEDAANAASRAWEETLRKREDGIDKLNELMFKQMQTRRALLKQDTEHFKEDLMKRIEDLQDWFDEQKDLYRRGSDERRELERHEADAIRNIRFQAAIESFNEIRELRKNRRNQIRNLAQDEGEALQHELREELRTAEKFYKRMVESYEVGTGDRVQAERRANKEIAALMRTQQVLVREIEKKRLAESLRTINDRITQARLAQENEFDQLKANLIMTLSAERMSRDEELALHKEYDEARLRLLETVSEEIKTVTRGENADLIALQEQRNQLLNKLDESQVEERVQIQAWYLRKVAEINAAARADLRANMNAFEKIMDAMWVNAAASAEDQGKKMSVAFRRAFENIEFLIGDVGVSTSKLKRKFLELSQTNFGQKLLVPLNKIRDAFDFVKEEGSQALEDLANSGFGKAAKAVGGLVAGIVGPLIKGFKMANTVGQLFIAGLGKGFAFAAKAVGALKGVIDKLSGAFSKALDGLAALTGFSFSLVDSVGEVNSKLEERRALEEQLAKGEISQKEFNEQSADLPANAQEASQNLITELIAGSQRMLQTFVDSAPVLLSELAAQLPALLTSVAEALPGLLQTLGDSIGPVVESIIGAAPKLLQALVEGIPAVLQGILAVVPMIITSLMEAIPTVIVMLTNAVTQIIAALPEIIVALVGSLPTIITALIDAIPTIVSALIQAIPGIVMGIVDAIPDIIVALLNGWHTLLLTFYKSLPEILDALLVMIPDIITMLVEMIPMVIETVVMLIPEVMTAVIQMFPKLIDATITALPLIINALIQAIPDVLKAIWDMIPDLLNQLTKLLIDDLFLGTMELVGKVIKKLWAFFRDVVKELFTLGIAETETFGDTPGVIRAGQKGMLARFAPNDFIVAAQTRKDLMKQVTKGFGGIDSLSAGAFAAPQMDARAFDMLSSAVLQAANQISGAGGLGGGAVQVTVTAEGRTLDDVLYTAGTRGKTPKLKKSIRKASGVKLGFDRGRFASSS
jgi:phage-related protein